MHLSFQQQTSIEYTNEARYKNAKSERFNICAHYLGVFIYPVQNLERSQHNKLQYAVCDDEVWHNQHMKDDLEKKFCTLMC